MRSLCPAFLALTLFACGDKGEEPDPYDLDADGIPLGQDCDDGDAAVGGPTLYYGDADGDGAAGDLLVVEACEAPEGFGTEAPDCDDLVASTHLGAPEVCNEVDDDCDGLVDDDDADTDPASMSTFYGDLDQDGYGDDDLTTEACVLPAHYAAQGGDCDDADTSVNPGTAWYGDLDGDGYGNLLAPIYGCEPLEGYVEDSGDCADLDAEINPGAVEICDEIDNDCDGATDDEDSDLDASTSSEWYPDVDGDGYGDPDGTPSASCAPAEGYGEQATDCDDLDALVNPDASEVCGDGVDNDCDGGPWPCTLAGERTESDATAAWRGEQGSDYAGYGLAVLGDFDGDGIDDFAIGAYGEDSGGSQAGRVYLRFGSTTAPSGDIDLATLSGVNGDAVSDYLGRMVAGPGDIDGDGYDELLVGGYGVDLGGASAGAAYLVMGGTSIPTGFSDVSDLASAVFVGASEGDWFAYAGGSAGDINDDGYDDFLISARFAEDDLGAAYLFYGSTVERTGEISADSAQAIFLGSDTLDYVGERNATTGVGDIDADGYDDFAVGAYSWDDGSTLAVGRVSLYYGRSALLTDGDLDDADVSLVGESDGDYFGQSVRGVDDLDGDGYDELLIGAPYAETDVGVAYLYGGSATGFASRVEVTEAVASFKGSNTFDYAGKAVTTGDLNVDGYADLVFAAYGYDTDSSQAGRIYLMFGHSSVAGAYDLEADADATVTGEDLYRYMGWNLAAEGDVDGDGAPDLLIGAYGLDSYAGGSSGGGVLFFPGGKL